VTKRFQQVLVSLFAIFSLAAASVSACTCSHHHHEIKVEKAHSCHEDSRGAASQYQEAAKDDALCLTSDADCICAENSPRVVGKADNVRVAKHIAAISVDCQPAIVHGAIPSITARIDFVKPFYLSDSFYNLAPKRGPPVI
jgi:hypothetical protein